MGRNIRYPILIFLANQYFFIIKNFNKMKLQKMLYSVAAISMIGGLASCSSQDEPVAGNGNVMDLSNAQTISLSVSLPESEMKTRGADPTLGKWEDGLLKFQRDINKIWYGVYHNGDLLYTSFQSNVNQAVYDADKDAFYLDIQIPKIGDSDIVPADYSVFFFAGNSADNVFNGSTTSGVGIDYSNKTLYAYPQSVNTAAGTGEFITPQQYDYFAKYSTLDKMLTEDFKGSVVLTRPFAQVTLLTDELCAPAVLSAYAPNGGKVSVATTVNIASGDAKTLPVAWKYEADELVTENIPSFVLNANAWNSTKNDTNTQVVTFKDRQMFCLASYLILATDAKKNYTDGNDKFNFEIAASGDINNASANLSVLIPGGLKANEKYVVYNKRGSDGNGGGNGTDPEDPDNPDKPTGGEGGLFSAHYVIDIIANPAWATPGNNTGF